MVWTTREALDHFPNLLRENDELRAENNRLRDFNQRLMAELAQHGWGDFHYGDQPQDPAIVRLLKEGNFGHVYSNTEAPSTDATPPAESSGGIRQRENSMGRRWSGEEPYYTSVLFDEGEPG